MAYLYQEILKVPGLTGTSRQRQEQLFKRLYPNERYTASYSQNVKLLQAVQSGAASKPAAKPASTQKNNLQSQVKAIVDKTKQVKNFEDLLKFEQYYSPELAQTGVREQVERQFAPQIESTIGGVKQEFSNRGLFRSGMRGQSEQRAFADLAEQAGTTAEQLLAAREAQAREGYANLQSQFEKSPTTYKGPKSTDFKPYQVKTPEMYSTTRDIYGGSSTATNAPYSYLQGYREYLQRTSPDYYKKFYGGSTLGVPRNI